MIRNLKLILVILLLVVGCAEIPVREEVRVDLSLPVGKIEKDIFKGIRYPFRVSLPSQQLQALWKSCG